MRRRRDGRSRVSSATRHRRGRLRRGAPGFRCRADARADLRSRVATPPPSSGSSRADASGRRHQLRRLQRRRRRRGRCGRRRIRVNALAVRALARAAAARGRDLRPLRHRLRVRRPRRSSPYAEERRAVAAERLRAVEAARRLVRRATRRATTCCASRACSAGRAAAAASIASSTRSATGSRRASSSTAPSRRATCTMWPRDLAAARRRRAARPLSLRQHRHDHLVRPGAGNRPRARHRSRVVAAKVADVR